MNYLEFCIQVAQMRGKLIYFFAFSEDMRPSQVLNKLFMPEIGKVDKEPNIKC